MALAALLGFAAGCGGHFDGDAAGDGATGGCDFRETAFGGHCYAIRGIKWIDYAIARQLCLDARSQVVAIESAAEDDFVFGILPPTNQAAWIGLTRQGAGFVWEGGGAADFVDWAPGEPNNDGGDEGCAVIWGPALSRPEWHGRWNDEPCSAAHDTVVCERTP